MSQERSPHVASLIDNEVWNVASGDGPQGPFLLRWRTPILQPGQLNGYDRLLQIGWRYAPEGSGMLPPAETDAPRERFEGDVVEAFERDYHAVLVCVWTYDGAVEWDFYTSDVGECAARIGRMPHPFGKYPITMSAQDDPEWRFLREDRVGKIESTDNGSGR